VNSFYKPRVSVIIPSFNHAYFIGHALQSLLDQTYTNWEAIIIDNHSSDNTDEVVCKFKDPRIKLRKIFNNGVIAASRNMGIREAKGELIAFLDSDDWWDRQKLERVLDEINNGADVVYHDLYIARSLNQSVFNEQLHSTEPIYPMFKSLLCTAMSIPNSSVIVRKELLIKIGGISENKNLISIEDYDTWIRLSKLTEKFARIPEVLGYYWSGGGNISIASPAQCNRIEFLYNQYMSELNSPQKKRARGFLAYRIARIAMSYGDRTKAQNFFLQAICSPINLMFRIKSIYFFSTNVLLRFYQ
jgi:glycosyltransferase involved in cell wall biosynthesis